MKTLRWEPAALASLRHAPPESKRRIRQSLRDLAATWPTAGDVDVRPLQLDGDWFRVRCGSWRAVFQVSEDAIRVLHVFHRRDGYGWMERT